MKNKVEYRKISEFTTDPRNANLGSERGLRVLDDSIAETGLGRSIVTDKNGVIIGGNKTTERSVDRGFDDAVVVHTTGKQLVVVQRDDLDLSDTNPNNPARKLAYYDNVASQHLTWDANQIAADVANGLNLSGLWTQPELAIVLSTPQYESDTENNYTRKVEVPLYEPSQEKPQIAELFDDSRTQQLVAEIDAEPSLNDAERAFLTIAAQRHTILHFTKIADLYAHGTPELQRLMENSALVIIDFNRAIELGYVRATKAIAELVGEENDGR